MSRHRVPTPPVGERIIRTIGYIVAGVILGLTIFILLVFADARDHRNVQVTTCDQVPVEMYEDVC